MEFKLNEEQQMIRDTAREYAQNCLAPRVEEIERAEKFPDDLFKLMSEMGFISIGFPEEYGGLDLGYLATSLAIEEISKVSGSAGTVLTVTLLPLDAIHMYGNQAQKDQYLPAGIRGDWKGSFAFTEAGTGSDPKQLTTIATKTGEGTYKISGVKRFISNAAYEGPMVLFAKEAETEEFSPERVRSPSKVQPEKAASLSAATVPAKRMPDTAAAPEKATAPEIVTESLR